MADSIKNYLKIVFSNLIAVADKEYTNHTFLLRFLRVFSSIPQNASAVEGDSGHASAIYEPPVCCYNGENNKKE